jgi:hypothetical protein
MNIVLKKVEAIGNANILSNGNTIQRCILTTELEGVVIVGKQFTDMVEFEIPNSEMVGKEQPLTSGWAYIRDVLAPQWVIDNYSNSVV